MCLCVCMPGYFGHMDLFIFIFMKATRKYDLDWSVLELILWVQCPGVRLYQKPARLSILCLPFSSRHGSGARNVSLCLTVLYTGPPRRGMAVTELSQGCHRWFCAKSAASVNASGEGWGGWQLCSWHSRDCLCGSVSRRRSINYRWQSPPILPLTSAFVDLHLESTEQWHARWFRWSRITKTKESSHDAFHKSLK